jgi:hypothetical protein
MERENFSGIVANYNQEEIELNGNTYENREPIKAEGFSWNPSRKTWNRKVEDRSQAIGIIYRLQKNTKKTEKTTLNAYNREEIRDEMDWNYI